MKHINLICITILIGFVVAAVVITEEVTRIDSKVEEFNPRLALMRVRTGELIGSLKRLDAAFQAFARGDRESVRRILEEDSRCNAYYLKVEKRLEDEMAK